MREVPVFINTYKTGEMPDYSFQLDFFAKWKYGAAEDPYQIILCTIPRKHRAGFLKAMEDLPELMSRMGKMDYDAFCRSVMLDAAQYLRGERTGDRSLPRQ